MNFFFLVFFPPRLTVLCSEIALLLWEVFELLIIHHRNLLFKILQPWLGTRSSCTKIWLEILLTILLPSELGQAVTLLQELLKGSESTVRENLLAWWYYNSLRHSCLHPEVAQPHWFLSSNLRLGEIPVLGKSRKGIWYTWSPKPQNSRGVGGGEKTCQGCFQPTDPETYQSNLMFCFQVLLLSNTKVGLNH